MRTESRAVYNSTKCTVPYVSWLFMTHALPVLMSINPQHSQLNNGDCHIK